MYSQTLGAEFFLRNLNSDGNFQLEDASSTIVIYRETVQCKRIPSNLLTFFTSFNLISLIMRFSIWVVDSDRISRRACGL